MLITESGFRIFNEYDLSAILGLQLDKLKKEVVLDVKSRKYEEDSKNYIQDKVREYQLNPLKIHSDLLTVTSSEHMIPAEYFPFGFNVRPGQQYSKEVLSFHLPFEGDMTLLKSVPSTRILWTEEMRVDNGEIIFDIINFNNNADEIQRERDRIVKYVVAQSSNVNSQVSQYNSRLSSIVESTLQEANIQLVRHSDLLAKLGTPLKMNDIAPPVVSRKPPVLTSAESKKYDVFVCHASEDKGFVDVLAKKMTEEGIEVWYDRTQLNWGDDLRSAIDEGLKSSKFGIVVFSKAFFKKKKWTEYELNGLFALEKDGRKVILPIWHEVDRSDVLQYGPTFADRLAKNSSDVDDIIQALKKLLGR